MGSFPQGRNVTQYQFIDDYSLNRGKHNLKFGANFRRYDVSDHNFFYNSPAVYFGYTDNGLQNFADGLAYQYRQALNLSSDVPIAMWGLGVYGMDEWNIKPNLKVTLALRVERNSNPVCQTNCFANFKTGFNSLASVTNSDPGSVPYSSDIMYNQHQAFPGVDAVDLSPRFGFSWSPGSNNKTVISGGFGIFYDSPPEGLVDDLLLTHRSVTFRVRPSAGVLGFDPAGGAAIWQAAANAFSITRPIARSLHSSTRLAWLSRLRPLLRLSALCTLRNGRNGTSRYSINSPVPTSLRWVITETMASAYRTPIIGRMLTTSLVTFQGQPAMACQAYRSLRLFRITDRLALSRVAPSQTTMA